MCELYTQKYCSDYPFSVEQSLSTNTLNVKTTLVQYATLAEHNVHISRATVRFPEHCYKYNVVFLCNIAEFATIAKHSCRHVRLTLFVVMHCHMYRGIRKRHIMRVLSNVYVVKECAYLHVIAS